MISTKIKGVGIREELTYCEIDASTGLPTLPPDAEFEAVEFLDASQIVQIGDAMQSDGTGERVGYTSTPPEVLHVGTGAVGDPVRLIRSGEITIDAYFYAGWPFSGDHMGSGQLVQLLASVCGYETIGSECNSEITGVTASGEITIEDSTTPLGRGDVVRIYGPAGKSRNYYAIVTAKSSNTVTVVPPMTGTEISGDGSWTIMRVGGYGLTPITGDGETYTIRLYGDGWVEDCFGCVLTGLTLSLADDTRAVKASYTIRASYVETHESTAQIPLPTLARGGVCHMTGAPIMAESARPRGEDGYNPLDPALSRTCVEDFELSIEWTVEAPSCGLNLIPYGRPMVTDAAVSVSYKIPYSAEAAVDLTRRYAQQQVGALVFGMSSAGGRGGGREDHAQGAAILIPDFAITTGVFANLDEGKGYGRITIEGTLGSSAPTSALYSGQRYPVPLILAASEETY